MLILYLTVFVDLIGFGMAFPLLPFFAQSFGASAFEISVLIATYSAGQIFAAPLWGRLSDRFGRKLILLTTLAGGAASYLWFGFADSLFAMFCARALSGVMAGNISVAQAYLADITDDAGRAGAMGRLGAAFGLGFVVGPALSSLLIGPDAATAAEFQRPFLAAAGLSMTAVLLGLVFLREPARRAERRRSGGMLAAARGNGIPVLIALTFTVTLVFTQLITIFPLWTHARLDWGAREVGYAYAYIGLCMAVLQGAALGPLTRCLGVFPMLLAGTVAMSVGLLLMPALPSLNGFLVAALLLCIGSSFSQPTFTALISQRAPADHQGAVLGLANAISSVGRILAPPIAGLMFDHVGVDWPMLCGGVMLWLVILSLVILARRQRPA